jgi:hypothetical protein
MCFKKKDTKWVVATEQKKNVNNGADVGGDFGLVHVFASVVRIDKRHDSFFNLVQHVPLDSNIPIA